MHFCPSALYQAICLLLLHAIQPAVSTATSAIVPLKSVNYGTSFSLEVEIGNQTFNVIADSGSADLWVFGVGWKCYIGKPIPKGNPEPQKKCLSGNETYTQSSTFHSISSEWLGVHYGSGNVYGDILSETLRGRFPGRVLTPLRIAFSGYDDVHVGSVMISQQEFGVVNATTSWEDSTSSGILGLGYPEISQIHPINYTGESSLQLLEDRILYPTVLTRIAGQGVEPYFSMALERTPRTQEVGFGGYLAFGTLPSVTHGAFVTTPVEITKTLPKALTNGTSQISEWTISVDAVTWDGRTDSEAFQVIVDSGNWLFVLPQQMAHEINNAFKPPAKLSPIPDEDQAYYAVPCDATPPADFGIKIAGKMFNIDSQDMIWMGADGTCYSSVAPGVSQDGIELLFLGDQFLKNVVAVFDFGKNEMKFAERMQNGTSVAASSGSTRMTLCLPLFVLVASIVAVLI